MIEILIGVLCLAVGAAVGFAVATQRSGAVRADSAVASARAADLERQLTAQTQAAEAERTRLRGEHHEQLAALRADQERVRREFQALSSEALREQQQSFLDMAEQRLARERHVADAALAKREEAVRTLVEPMALALDKVQRQTTETDRARAEGQAQLTEQVRAMLAASDKLDKRTSDFINTLRRSDVRGNWGEVQLRRVVELAGMVQHVDFDEQETVRDSEGKNLRPDMTVRLAGGRTVVVDSKVALSALLEAFETDDEGVRADRLSAHARQVKKHVDDLSGKRYWDQFESAPEFVVMFVPSEAFYQSALEQDPALQEYAFAKRVVIATPTTLVAMLRTVAHAWKEDALARDAKHVLAAGTELYERFIKVGEHLERVGKSLDSATRAYNETVGSIERRVVPAARRFRDLQQLEAEFPVQQIETPVRELTTRDLTGLDPA